MPIPPLPPLRVREADGSPNVIPVFEIAMSGATVTRLGATGVQIMVDSGGGGSTYVLGTPVLVGSGGTGQLTLTTFGLLYGSGASPMQSLAAMVSGSLVVGSGTTVKPFVLPGGAQGQYLISTGGVVGNLAWVNTLGGSASITYAATGNAYITYDAAADLTAERVLTSGTGLAVASDTTNFFVSLVTPVSVSSGGTGVGTLTAFGLLYGSGASAIQAEAAMVSGSLVVGSGTTVRPHILPGGAAGQYLISTGGVVGNLAWVATAGAGTTIVYAATGNAYLTFDAAGDLTNERTFISGTGLSVTSDNTNFFASVNTNVRDKTAGFFAGGNLTTTHIAANSRVFIPFNMELRDVRLAVVTTHVGANIIVNVGQFGTPVAAMSAFFTNALRPIIATGTSLGSAGTISNNVMFLGSWLGFSIDQVGSTTAGSDLTVTVIARSS